MIFKRLSQQKDNQLPSKNNMTKKTAFKKILSHKNSKYIIFKGYYKGLPIYAYKFLKQSQVSRFQGSEITIIPKPCTVIVLNKFVKYRGINTILHEIRYTGDKNKTCRIRIQIGKTFAEMHLGNHEFETLYICKNVYSDYVIYREKYKDKIVKPTASRYIKKLKHFYDSQTYEYLGERL